MRTKRERGKALDNVQSLERALRIIDLLAHSGKPMGVTEIGKLIGVHKSTAYRLVNTLRQFGYVDQDKETEKYFLGLKPLELSSIINERLDIKDIIHPYLEELADKTNETVHLAVREGDEIVYIDKVESKHTIRMYSRVGARAPLYCTALGKCLLAFGPEELIKKWISKDTLPQRTPNTIKTGKELDEELEKVREQGYALDREEFEPGIRCIGVPIINRKGKAISAISISIPSFRLTEERLQELIPILLKTRDTVSEKLKYL
ncbi:MAG: IclR family transcriptional regulator [bacterium]|nr:IclR family transcriptional regulator [bacterium]